VPFGDDYSILIDYVNPFLQKRDVPIFFNAPALELGHAPKACGIATIDLTWFAKQVGHF
jgi:hypothetical protein